MFFKKSQEKEKMGDAKASEGEEKQYKNLFKELGELDFGKKEEEEEDVRERKKFESLKLSVLILSILNGVLFFSVILIGAYVMIQQKSDLSEKMYLSSFCSLLRGKEVVETLGTGAVAYGCASVSYMENKYSGDYNKEKQEIVKRIEELSNDFIALKNFQVSPEVSFLVKNKDNRLKPLEIINNFDILKNDFASALGAKDAIVCKGGKISSDFTFEINCTAYSKGWEIEDTIGGKGIPSPQGNLKHFTQGTSISVAASFINFIEKNPSYGFLLLEKPKSFQANAISSSQSFYTKETNFVLKLQYVPLKSTIEG